jgi:hypothetical protein
LATTDNNVAAVIVNNSDLATMAVYNGGGGDDTESDVIRATGHGGSCSISTFGNTTCSGTLKSTVKATTAGGAGHNVETYAVQAAENWFEDAGAAQLVNGVARVNLEAIFGQTVNTQIEYHVFLTPDGDCKGLYVSAKNASGFEVHELGGGTSSVAFEYRIMAKRVGHESERLLDITAKAQAKAGRKMANDPQSVPAVSEQRPASLQ